MNRDLSNIPEENKNGKCFEVAVLAALNNQDWVLVHGIVTGQGVLNGIKYVHAWAECNEEVIDLTAPVNLQRLPREVYYALGHVEYTKKYGHEEIVNNLLKFKHYGPWEQKFYEYV